MKTNMEYSEAFTKLEQLVAQIEDEAIPLDTLADKVQQANELITYCQTKLRVIETSVRASDNIQM